MCIFCKCEWKAIVVILLLQILSGQALCDELIQDGSLNIQTSENVIIPETSLLTGAATYRLPIKAPPGRAGVQPNISLTYNSYADNGIVGVGWKINIGWIQRSKKGGVDYSGTDFEYHSGNSVKELVPIGTPGSNGYGSYRPKIEECFSRFTFSANGWEILTREGITYNFGTTSASRQDFNSGSDIFKWCLDKVTDPNSNYMTYAYEKNQGQIYPDYIQYSGNTDQSESPYYRIGFEYETSRPDPNLRWDLLNSVKTDKRLQYIKTYKDINGTDDLINTYTLQYATASSSPRSRLSSFQMSGPSSETLPPVGIKSSDGGDATYNSTGITNDIFSPGANVDNVTVYMAELNGDGLLDILLCDNGETGEDDTFYPVLSKADGSFEGIDKNGDSYFSESDGITSPTLSSSKRFADINHDGLSDLIAYGYMASWEGGWPTQFFPASHKITTYLSQGDGYFSTTGQTLDISSLFAAESDSVKGIYFAEVNGDQLTDMIIDDPDDSDVHIYESDGLGSFTHTATLTLPTIPYSNMFFADVNGDGFSDLIRATSVTTFSLGYWYQFTTTAKAYVYFGRGNGNFAGTSINTDLTYADENTRSVHLVDANGDGLTDLLLRGNEDSSENLIVYLSKGDGTFTYLDTNEDITGGVSYFTDTDADGLADIVKIPLISIPPPPPSGWGTGGIEIDIGTVDEITTYLAIGDGKADLVKEVTSSLGAVTTLDYTASLKFQDPSEEPDLPFVLQTLSDVTVNDGLGNLSTTTYVYEDGSYVATERDFRGFGSAIRTNPDGTTVTTKFHQDEFKKGKRYEVLHQAADGTDLEKRTFNWLTDSIITNESEFVYLDEKRVDYYDDGSATAYKLEEYTYDDDQGYAETLTVSGTNIGESITTTYDYIEKGTWIWRKSSETIVGSSTGTARETDYTYYSDGNLQTISHELNTGIPGDNPVITMGYDSYGNMESRIDGEGNEWTYTYDTATQGFVSSITNPLGHVVEYTYDYSCGKVETYTDENDNTTTYDYDGFGRLIDIIYPDNGMVDVTYVEYPDTYNPMHVQVDVKENAGDWMTTIDYIDGLGRKVQSTTESETASDWIVRRQYYDDMGRNYKTAGPLFRASTGFASTLPSATDFPYEEVTEYDDRSRPVEVKRPDGQNTWQVVAYDYDGYETSITDPDGSIKKETRDALDRIVKITEYLDSIGYNTVYGYNAAGDLEDVWKYDSDGSTVLYHAEMDYDLLGRKTHMDDLDMGEWDYTYDKNNNLDTQTDALNQTIDYEYDPINRIEDIYYPTGTPDIAYEYDSASIDNGIGRLHKIDRGSVVTTINEYDAMGRLESETKRIDSVNYTTQYAYDLSGKQVQITYPDSTVVNTSYHAGSGLIDEVYTGSVIYGALSNYTPSGKIGYLLHQNDADTAYYYDDDTERLTGIVTQNGSSQEIQNRYYTYSPAGDIIQIVDSINNVTYGYEYDDLHRLISETSSDIDYHIPEPMILEYEYNDTNHVNAVTDIKLNGGDHDFSYDSNGNMINGSDLTDPADVEIRTIDYDADNMPVQIVHGGSGTTSIVYDGKKKRIKKTNGSNVTRYINKYYEIINGVPTKYVFAGNLRIAKIDSTGTRYYHKDHLGSTSMMTNAGGTSIETSEYLPYGGQREQIGTSITDYKFTDQELDTQTGLYNYDARLYDPVIGRFITPDTIIPDLYNPQSLNRYNYVINNPLRFTDPTGHWDIDGNSSGGFGGHGVGNPGSYGGEDSVGAPGFGDGSPAGFDNPSGSGVNESISETRSRSIKDRSDYDMRSKMAIDPKSKSHTHRNQNNQCPNSKSKAINHPDFVKDNLVGSIMYHGRLKGKETFRGRKGSEYGNCQCTYNSDGTLDDYSEDMGTYNYADPSDSFNHMTLDMAPHNYNSNYEGGLTNQF